MIWAQKTSLIPSPCLLMCFTKPGIYMLGVSILPFSMLFRLDFVKVPIMWYFLFFILYFRLLTDFVCLYTYKFWLSLWKIVRSSVILLLSLLSVTRTFWHLLHILVRSIGKLVLWEKKSFINATLFSTFSSRTSNITLYFKLGWNECTQHHEFSFFIYCDFFDFSFH